LGEQAAVSSFFYYRRVWSADRSSLHALKTKDRYVSIPILHP